MLERQRAARLAFVSVHPLARVNTGALQPPNSLCSWTMLCNELASRSTWQATCNKSNPGYVIAEGEMRGFLKYLRFSFPMSTKNPGFTAVALFSLSPRYRSYDDHFSALSKKCCWRQPCRKIPRASWFYGNRTRAKDCRIRRFAEGRFHFDVTWDLPISRSCY